MYLSTVRFKSQFVRMRRVLSWEQKHFILGLSANVCKLQLPSKCIGHVSNDTKCNKEIAKVMFINFTSSLNVVMAAGKNEQITIICLQSPFYHILWNVDLSDADNFKGFLTKLLAGVTLRVKWAHRSSCDIGQKKPITSTDMLCVMIHPVLNGPYRTVIHTNHFLLTSLPVLSLHTTRAQLRGLSQFSCQSSGG